MWYNVGMADMLKTIPPLFGLPSSSSGWSADAPSATEGKAQPEPAAPTPHFSEVRRHALEDAPTQLRRALANGGRRLLLRHFLSELSKLLDEQEQVLQLLETARAWSLPLLNRQFYAVRSAAESLKLRNLAQVAGRAEVLVNLIDTGELAYDRNHGTVIHETHRLLRKLVGKVFENDGDEDCYSITQTVWSMHAALDPSLCEYEPGSHGENSVAQSTDPSARE